MVMTAPAESALDPEGATYTTTGTFAARKRLTILGPVDGVVDVLLRDRVDVVVEVNGEHARYVALREDARRRRERSESERKGTKPPQIAA